MLPKKRRIEQKDFPQIIGKGKRYNSEHILMYLVNKGVAQNADSQISFSVSKKIYPKATDRNRCRRRGYYIVSKHTNKIKPGHLIFFSIKMGLPKKDFNLFEEEVTELLSKAGVIS